MCGWCASSVKQMSLDLEWSQATVHIGLQWASHCSQDSCQLCLNTAHVALCPTPTYLNPNPIEITQYNSYWLYSVHKQSPSMSALCHWYQTTLGVAYTTILWYSILKRGLQSTIVLADLLNHILWFIIHRSLHTWDKNEDDTVYVA